MEPAATDRIQRMIDAEAAERFPPDAVPRLVLLRYGDHPVIEPGELYLLVILGQDGAARDAWMAEHFDRLEDFRARRLPEVKRFMVTTGARDSAGRPPTRIMQMDGISLLDPDEDEIARGLTPVTALLGSADLATLDALITAGIAASRAEAARWASARTREQPAYAQLSERAREPGEPQARAGLERAVLDQLQTRLGEQVREHFPGGGVQRIETGRKARSWYFDGQEGPRAKIVGRWFTTLLWFSVVAGRPEMRGRSVSSQAWPKLVSI